MKPSCVYHYCYHFIYLFYDQNRKYGSPLNATFWKWPPSQISCPPLA